MTVYLLHLQQPLSRGVSRSGKPLLAGHYIGFTEGEVGERMAAHMAGNGANFTRVCVERNIAWQIARIWKGPRATRWFERRLKKCKNGPDLCPVCNPDALNRMQL